MARKKYIVLAALIVLLGATLRLWGLGSSDLNGDAAHYSFRSFGWIDYLGSQVQTAPIQWFDSIPWWGPLSFHDHPPLVFFIQHMFFRIFGDSTFVALLPFAIAGVVTLIVLYWSLAVAVSRGAALAAMLVMAILSYAVFASRTGYLEGVQILFLTTSIGSFLVFLKKREARYLILWGIATGLSLLSKYTSLFLIPSAAIYLAFYERRILASKKFLGALALPFILLTPVIIYNVMVFRTRGHFDTSLSAILGIQHHDFGNITRAVNLRLLFNLETLWNAITFSISLPFLLVFLTALAYTILQIIKGGGTRASQFILITIVCMILMFSIAGAETRFLSIIAPLVSMLVGTALYDFWQGAGSSNSLKIIRASAVAIVILLEAAYTINTNLLRRPVGWAGLTYSPSRFYSAGYQELETYLTTKIIRTLPEPKKIKKISDLDFIYNFRGGTAVMLDERLNWFPALWHIQRFQFYYETPIINLGHVFDAMNKEKNTSDVIGYLRGLGANDIWLIYADEAAIGNPTNADYSHWLSGFIEYLEKNNIHAQHEIKNWEGKTAFKLYHLSAN